MRRLVSVGVVLLALCSTLGGSTARERCAMPVTVTAYSHTGHPTASGRMPAPGMLALSRDLERTLGLRFGAEVTLEGLGTYTFRDRMPARWQRRVDLVMASPQAARQFGRRQACLLLPRAPGTGE